MSEALYSLPRCKIRKPFIDVSGSMCTSYSTMGNMEMEESQNSILLLVWLFWHLKSGTPLLIHENVKNFASTLLEDEAVKLGYDHATFKVRPEDVGIPLGRVRVHHGLHMRVCSKGSSSVYMYIYMHCTSV